MQPPDPPDRAALQDRLIRAGAALSVDLDQGQASRLVDYLQLLARWNTTYNLTAVRDPERMLVQHVFDCLAIIAPLRRHLARLPRPRILDVGSGGGLPGAVIAVTCPAIDVTCIDAVGKKAAFVQQVAATLSLRNLHAVHGRVESLVDSGGYDMIVSRAFASLADFVRWTAGALKTDSGVWVAMKGKLSDDERNALPTSIDLFHVEQLIVPDLNAERCLVWMRRAAAPSAAVRPSL